MPDDNITDRLIAALEGYGRLIDESQDVLARYLEPAGGVDARHAVEELLGILDGLRQRIVEDAARAAIIQQ